MRYSIDDCQITFNTYDSTRNIKLVLLDSIIDILERRVIKPRRFQKTSRCYWMFYNSSRWAIVRWVGSKFGKIGEMYMLRTTIYTHECFKGKLFLDKNSTTFSVPIKLIDNKLLIESIIKANVFIV